MPWLPNPPIVTTPPPVGAYATISLSQLISHISDLMDDTSQVYWTQTEIVYAVYEGLRIFGSISGYWSDRGAFSISPAHSGPFYDLSTVLPALRSRTWALGNIVQEIQFSLLEPAVGITGAGMSQQVSISSILRAVQYARDRFVLDAHLPLSLHSSFANPPSPQGDIAFPQRSVFVHRASWQDNSSGVWTNLWRDDMWAIDKNNGNWTLEPGRPAVYCDSELSPLMLQISPPPDNTGTLEAVTVDSLQLDLTDPASLLAIPDEYSHAVKYGALSQILSSEGQIKDPMRAEYAESRYSQAVAIAKSALSLYRVMVESKPLPLDTLAALDAGDPYWRNKTGQPETAGAMYDIVAFSPGIPDRLYGATADVVRSAPLPGLGGSGFIQLGEEDINDLISYVCHVLTFKCGGNELKSTFSGHDDWLKAAASRNAIFAAKVRYLKPTYGQAQREWAIRPSRIEVAK